MGAALLSFIAFFDFASRCKTVKCIGYAEITIAHNVHIRIRGSRGIIEGYFPSNKLKGEAN